MGQGSGFISRLKNEPDFIWALLPVFFLPLVVIALKLRASYYLLLLLVISVSLSIGFSSAKIRETLVSSPVLQKRSFGTLTATVAHVELDKKAPRVVLQNVRSNDASIDTLVKIRLTVRTGVDDLAPGDIIEIKAVLLPPPAPVYPGSYDFQRDLYFQGIGAVGYAVSKPDILKKQGSLVDVETIRHQIARHIENNTPDEQTGFLLAIMVGEKSKLTDKLKDDMRNSGLAHLLAISGLHMMMLGGFIFFLTRLVLSCIPPIALNYPIKKISACIAITAVTGYLAISGLSISAIRAYLMITLVFLAICLDRRAISLRNLSIAALLILLIMPESMLGPSFQMSFAAVFCLIAVYEKWGEKLFILHGKSHFALRPVLYLSGVAFTSLVASAATAPFSIHHFGQLAVAGVVTNLIAIPLMGFWIMPWAILGFLLMPFDLSSIALNLSAMGVEKVVELASWGASLPYASLKVVPFSTEIVVLISLSGLGFLAMKSRVQYLMVLPMSFAFVLQIQNKLPDILVSESGKLVLIHTDNATLVNSRRHDRFEQDRWQSYYGTASLTAFLKDKKFNDLKGNCDPLGCSWKQKDYRVTYSENKTSHRSDCNFSNILISSKPVFRGCEKPELIIDYFDFWRNGAHAIYLNTEKPRLQTVNGGRGDRPWVRHVGSTSSDRNGN
nr:ComEC/Rec2 family competence protein [Sneathiella limimaris]